ncbi:MAG: hypothetical protein ACK5JF_11390 [Oscillospiraceae bacterium]
MLKKMTALFCCAILAFVLVGCSFDFDSLLGKSGPKDPEEVYQALEYLITIPTSTETHSITGKKITFTATALTDPEQYDFDEEDGGTQTYVYACIEREHDYVFLLNVDALDTPPAAGDVFSVSGSVEGYIYSTVDNSREEILDVFAKEITMLTPNYDNYYTNSNVDVGQYTYTFRDAYLTSDTMGPAVVLYYEFTNNSNDDAKPDLDRFYIDQNEVTMGFSNFPVSLELDPGALSDGMMPEDTKAGSTTLYYTILTLDVDVTADPLEIFFYDDDFNLKNLVTVPVIAE